MNASVRIATPLNLRVDQPPSDPRRALLFGLAVIVFGLGGFFTWTMLAPLDEGVPLPGVIAVESQRKTVQHLSGGIVEKILVKEGEQVEAGQQLLILDTETQRGQQAVIANQLAALRAQMEGLRANLPQRRRQLESFRKQSADLAPLVEEQLYPRNQFADLERQITQVEAQVTTDQANLQQTAAQISELGSKNALLQADIDRAVVVAPVAGTVFDLNVHTVRGVIAPGGKILELVPQGDTLVITAQVPTHLGEYVHAGLPAKLRFTALSKRRTPVVDGKVELVSADRLTSEDGHQSYYTAKVSVPAASIAALGKVTLSPGMPVEVIVVTGERTFFDYLTKPLMDSFARGLKER